jgi:uncharacterized protein
MANHEAGVFEAMDVTWSLGETTVDGTLLRPHGNASCPGAVLVAGSGPTDRDWNTPLLPGTNGSGRLLAEAFARAGVASVRFDKRASGPRARDNMRVLAGKISMQSHLDEVAGAVECLASQPGVRRDHLFVVANSEGTLHALNYQLSAPSIPFAGLVLIAPPGRSVGAVARTQLLAQLKALPDGEKMLAAYDAAIVRFSAGEFVEADPSLPAGVQALLLALTAPANLPFTRELWMSDGAELLRRVDLPVLVVIGKKDVQVDWLADGDPLRLAAGDRSDVKFLFPDDANHVLKHEARARATLTGAEAVQRYNADDAELDEEALSGIIAWLRERATR